ncbi:MAG: hypothetical protein GX601_08025, partial [Anaerolineales bacterium]|nr:hypothetical protein [Anaerolineales bacterium]
LKMLVTSRAPLRVSGEQVHAVTPLSLAGGPESIDQSEATLFFVDRATATVPSFRLTAGNREIVGEICRRLDGLPLAIELAVARLVLFSPAELLARMDARLALLRDGATDQPDRLRSLHASIAWSYDLLNVDEQALFMRLAVFMGGWTLEAAEAVAAGSERDTSVQGGLTTLISRNLVWSEVQPDGTSRYGLLETIREFAEERLVAHGEDAAARDRHASWVLELARRTRTGNHQFEQILAIGPLEPEHSNIEAALHWLAATGQAERLADLVIALEHHWEWNEYGVQGLGWCMRALEGRELSQSVRLEVLGGAAHLAEKLESPLAERLVEEYAAKAEECGTLRQRADAALLAGMHAEDSGDFPRAEGLFLLACTQADQAGEAWISAQCSYHLGVVALGQGALDQAMATFDAAQAAATTIGDPLIPAWCLVYQALICCEQGNPERAAALLRNHPDMDQVGYRQHQPLLRAVASVVACRFDDYRRGARLLGSAIHDVPMRSPEK